MLSSQVDAQHQLEWHVLWFHIQLLQLKIAWPRYVHSVTLVDIQDAGEVGAHVQLEDMYDPADAALRVLTAALMTCHRYRPESGDSKSSGKGDIDL